MKEVLKVTTREYAKKSVVTCSYDNETLIGIPKDELIKLFQVISPVSGMKITMTLTVDDDFSGGDIHMRIETPN